MKKDCATETPSNYWDWLPSELKQHVYLYDHMDKYRSVMLDIERFTHKMYSDYMSCLTMEATIGTFCTYKHRKFDHPMDMVAPWELNRFEVDGDDMSVEVIFTLDYYSKLNVQSAMRCPAAETRLYRGTDSPFGTVMYTRRNFKEGNTVQWTKPGIIRPAGFGAGWGSAGSYHVVRQPMRRFPGGCLLCLERPVQTLGTMRVGHLCRRCARARPHLL